MAVTETLKQTLWQVWSGIAPDATAAMMLDTDGEDGDYLAESLLTVADSYLTGEALTEWHDLSSTERQRLALETVTS